MESISFFISNLGYGGAQRVTVNLASGFADRGYEVDVVAVNAEGDLMNRLPSEVRVIDLKRSRAHYCIPSLASYLKKERPDVMYSSLTYINTTLLVAKLISKVDTRIAVSEHSLPSERIEHSESRTKSVLLSLTKYLYPMADEIFAVSDDIAQEISQVSSIPREEITVVYNPVIGSEIKSKYCQEVDHPWFNNSNTDVILGVGRLDSRKDFSTLIKSFSKIESEEDIRLVILGDGSERKKLEELVRKLGIKENVSFPGFVNNPFPYMAHSSVFALSSVTEGFPSVLIEAMACGCPIVATDCSTSIRKILVDGKYGRIVPVNNPDTLSDALVKTLSEPGNTKNLQERSNRFSTERIVDDYEEILEKL